jgi:hypothetical protein
VDDVHVAYFAGEALWTYLNIPSLYTQAGFAQPGVAAPPATPTSLQPGDARASLGSEGERTRTNIALFASYGLLVPTDAGSPGYQSILPPSCRMRPSNSVDTGAKVGLVTIAPVAAVTAAVVLMVVILG